MIEDGGWKMERRSSIFHPRSSILVLLASLLLSGCVIKQPPPPDPVSHAPLVVDEAMQHREWPMSVAYYQNGETPAGPTGFILSDRPDGPYWQQALADAPIFVANCIACPIVLLCTPPFQPVIYPRGITEPSYNAMPPLDRQ
jgi:hypothetical protein